MKRCEGPRNRSILVIDDNKRCYGISNGVSPENAAGNICVIAAQISKQQHECTRRLNLLTQITECRLHGRLLSELGERKPESVCYAACQFWGLYIHRHRCDVIHPPRFGLFKQIFYDALPSANITDE